MSIMSEKQHALIASLAARIGEKALAKFGALAESVAKAQTYGLTVRDASNLIGALIAIAPAKAPAEATDITTEGYFLHDGRVFSVVRSRKSGNLYANLMQFSTDAAGAKRGRWVYERGAMGYLREAMRLTVEQAAAQGHLHGVCVLCGAALTDPESVTRGIGPVCAGKL